MFLNTLTLETRNQLGQDEKEHSRVSLLPNFTYDIILPNLKMQTLLCQEQLRQDDYLYRDCTLPKLHPARENMLTGEGPSGWLDRYAAMPFLKK